MSQDSQAMPLRRARTRKKTLLAALAILLTAAAALSAWRFLVQPKAAAPAAVTLTATVQRGTLTFSGNAIGTTARGTLTQAVGWTGTAGDLVVQSVLKTVGDTVAKGDPLLKLTDASVATVRQQLETSVAAARKALSQAEIDHQSALVAAKSTQEASLAAKTAAKQVYNETIQSLADAVASAKEALSNAKAFIHDNPALISTLDKQIAKAESDLAAAQKAAGTAQASLAAAEGPYKKADEAMRKAADQAAKARFALDAAEQYADAQKLAADDPVFAPYLASLRTGRADQEALETSAQAELAQVKAPYEQARNQLSQAQAQVSSLQQDLPTLKKDRTDRQNEFDQAKSGLANLQARYDQAVADQKAKTLTASQTYETTVQAGDAARTAYEIAIQKADQALADARSALANHEGNLAAFTTVIGDGTIRSDHAGTIASAGYAADGVLSAATPVAIFSNPAVLMVSASVDQADIASLAIGKTVAVTLSAGGRSYPGKVSAIAMKAAATSISAVKYTVTVTFDGDVANLASGQTVTVRFVKDTLENALYIDQKAIHQGQGGAYAEKQTNGGTTQVPVMVGPSNGQSVVILSGLAEGDVCVYSGNAVTAGSVRNAESAGTTSTSARISGSGTAGTRANAASTGTGTGQNPVTSGGRG